MNLTNTDITAYEENIFKVPIWGFKLLEERYHVLDYIKYIEELSENQESVSKSNFGGWQSQPNLEQVGIFQELVKNITFATDKILAQYTLEKYPITTMWANINNKYNSNAHHTHDGLLSGVFYLETPENSGKIVFASPIIRAGYSRIAHRPNYGITPEPLSLLIFPSWLEHYVEPNYSEERRISISFNIGE